MRVAFTLAGLVFIAAGASAQTGKQPARVTAAGAVARSGPGDKMPDTGAVPAGTPVVVSQVENDWVAIEPPAGQVSWMRYIHLADPDASGPKTGVWDAVVAADGPVEVAVGRAGQSRPLDVRKVSVPDGTIVRVIGPLVEHGGAKWLPVVPPAGDLRYLPRSSVEFTAARPPTFAVNSPPNTGPPVAAPTPPPEPTLAVPASVSRPAPPEPVTAHPLWQRAERADAAGSYAVAENSYLELAKEMNQANRPADADLCYARVTAVRERQRAARPPASPAPATPPASAGQWYGPGQLRLSAVKIDGRPAYALLRPDGKTACYVQAARDVDLDRFRGTSVDLYGSITYPGDLNGLALLTTSRVQAAR